MTKTRSSQGEVSESSATAVAKPSCEDLRQWVCIAPDPLFSVSGQESTICTLPHPKSGRPTQYVLNKVTIYEMVQFRQNHQSWFIDQIIQKDGSLFMLTKMDSLFIMLPYLRKSTVVGKFVPLDQILFDENSPDIVLVETCTTETSMNNVCDARDVDGVSYYRLNSDKLLAWLKMKVERLSSFLMNAGINLSGGSQAATFKKHSTGSSCNKDDAVRYAFSLIADYLDKDVSQQLEDALQIETKKSITESCDLQSPPAKKPKVDPSESVACLEDYRVATNASKDKKPVKLTNAQKSLAKADKRGMRSMSSFFTSKPK